MLTYLKGVLCILIQLFERFCVLLPCLWHGRHITFFKKNTRTILWSYFKEGPYEVRVYGASVFAQTTQSGNWTEAGRKGFLLLADYIFARKAAHPSIPMTAPVLSAQHKKGWTTRFVLPDGMTAAAAQSHTPKRFLWLLLARALLLQLKYMALQQLSSGVRMKSNYVHG